MVTRLGVTVVEAMEIVEIVTAKSWSARGRILPPSFYEQLLDC